MSHTHTLTREHEILLGRAAKAGDQDARQLLIGANSWLVEVVARGESSRSPAAHLTDLMQEGFVGLLEAVERYDPERGVRLSTYATYWIRMRVRRAARAAGGLPEIPMSCVSQPELRERMHQRPEEDWPDDRSDLLVDEREDSPVERAGDDERILLLRKALAGLSPRDRDVVTAVYGIGREREQATEVAARLGITSQRVSQLLRRVRRKLRREVE